MMSISEDMNSTLCQTVLVTDDDKDVRWALSSILKQDGFVVLEADSGPTALKILLQGVVDVMILDMCMANMNGLDVQRAARKAGCDTPIIFVSGFGTAELATEAGRMGASGFLTKPIRKEDLVLTIQMALKGKHRKKEDSSWVSGFKKEPWRVFGVSSHSQKIHELIAKVAPTDYTVIIGGETGVGKELVARMIHHLSSREKGPFITLDCGAINPTLIENELFGHEKGAFTGANTSRPGVFESAEGGTLFLDEIGNLPLAMQAKLLRVLQERQVCRVGSSTPIKLNVRVLAATNEKLERAVVAGDFRSDLFYRLNEFNIPVAPLRERRGDLLFLAKKFIEEAVIELNKQDCSLSEEAEKILMDFYFPGNVRELRNVMRRAVLVSDKIILPEHLNIDRTTLPISNLVSDMVEDEEEGDGKFRTFKEIVRQKVSQTERDLLFKALVNSNGNMAEAARALHIDYKTMREKSKDYHLSLTFKVEKLS